MSFLPPVIINQVLYNSQAILHPSLSSWEIFDSILVLFLEVICNLKVSAILIALGLLIVFYISILLDDGKLLF